MPTGGWWGVQIPGRVPEDQESQWAYGIVFLVRSTGIIHFVFIDGALDSLRK